MFKKTIFFITLLFLVFNLNAAAPRKSYGNQVKDCDTTWVPQYGNYEEAVAAGCVTGISNDLRVAVDSNITATPSIFGEVYYTMEVYPLQTVEIQLKVVSTNNTADTAGGTGAVKLLLTGLNDSYEVITEEIAMNGTTPVTTVNSYFRVNRVDVIEWGSYGANVGEIFVYIDSPLNPTTGRPYNFNNVLSGIGAGVGFSRNSTVTIPLGKTYRLNSNGYLAGFTGNTTFKLIAILPSGRRIETFRLFLSAADNVYKYVFPYTVVEKSFLFIEISSTAPNQASVFYEFKVIDN